jgi:hypothetical protein
MSQVQSIFITVTTTVSGTPQPTLNPTQLRDLQVSKNTGQIIALAVLGLFVFLALLMLICWGILRARRPPPPPQIENPDTVRHGRGAFLPIIGGKNRRSTASGLGVPGSRGKGNNNSTQTLVGQHETTQTRRLSMWAENPYTPSIPSPPLFAAHTRSSSAASLDRSGPDHQRSISSSSDSTSSTRSVTQGFVTRYYDGGSMDFVPLASPPPPMMSPKFGHVNHAPRVEAGRFSFDGEQRVSPIVSPLHQTALGIARYHQGSGVGWHDDAVYA